MEERLIYFTAVLGVGALAQWLAWRFKLPSILLLLASGFAMGQFYDQSQIVDQLTLFPLVSLAVAIILLEGGLTLKFSELKEAGMPVLRLVSLGALITWLISIPAAHYGAGFSWPVATLVAGILVVTGPTVIGPLLRTVKPKRTVNSILKWEGIVIDPVGAVLAVLIFGALFGWHHGHEGDSHGPEMGKLPEILLGIAKTLVIGIGLGWGAARLLVAVVRRHWVPDFLQSFVILGVGLALFSLSNILQHESGLLTITILGIGLANQHGAQVRHIIEFKETLRVLLISCLFIVLGGRVSIDQILDVWKEALAFLALLIVVVRPVAVFLSTIGSKLSWKEKVFLSMMAPRGIVAAAVSAIFALELSNTDGPYAAEAERIVPIVFTLIVGTVLFYGLLAGPVARKLGLASSNPQGVLFAGIRRWVIDAATVIQDAGFRVLLIDRNYGATSRARMAGLPTENANILSDYATEEIDLAGIGNFLAVTPNDQVNSLACMGFGHTMGRSNVFQLQAGDTHERSERNTSSFDLMGRVLFEKDWTGDRLDALEARGAKVKTTLLTDEFGLKEFYQRYNEDDAVVMFILRASGTLNIAHKAMMPPASGDSLISLVIDQDSPVVPTEEVTQKPNLP